MDYAYKDYPGIIRNAELNGFTAVEPTESTKPVSSVNSGTLEQILQHVASIDNKLK